MVLKMEENTVGELGSGDSTLMKDNDLAIQVALRNISWWRCWVITMTLWLWDCYFLELYNGSGRDAVLEQVHLDYSG